MANQSDLPFYESVGFKTLVAAVIILIFVAIFVAQRRSSDTTGPVLATPAGVQQDSADEAKPPAPEPASNPQPPQYPMESWSNHTSGAAPAPVQANAQQQLLPGETPPAAKTQQYPLPGPTTEVHSLNDAGAVMGTPAGETGEVGVTRTYSLPGQGQGKNPTRPGDPQRP